MPSYGNLEDDAFVPVQDDPSKAVADFGKYTTSAAQASFQIIVTGILRRRRHHHHHHHQRHWQRQQHLHQTDITIHAHRYKAETRFRQPKNRRVAPSMMNDDERRKFPLDEGKVLITTAPFHQQQRVKALHHSPPTTLENLNLFNTLVQEEIGRI